MNLPTYLDILLCMSCFRFILTVCLSLLSFTIGSPSSQLRSHELCSQFHLYVGMSTHAHTHIIRKHVHNAQMHMHRMHACMHAHTHTHIHKSIQMCSHAHICIHIQKNIHMRSHACIYTHA